VKNALFIILFCLLGEAQALRAEDTDAAQALTQSARHDRRIVFLDPGHTSAEPGVVLDGFNEAEFTYKLATLAAKELQSRGIKAVLSRSAGQPVSIQARVEAANRISPFAFVSLHVNYSYNPQQRGIRIFIPVDDADVYAGSRALRWRHASAVFAGRSKRLAQCLVRTLGQGEPSGRNVQSLNLAVFQGLAMPAAVVELGFASQAETFAALKQEATINEMARAVSRALSDFCQERTDE
jgi:N-acetylmuramoyl-L-alanine amidase